MKTPDVAPDRVPLYRIVEGGRVGFVDASGAVRIAPEVDDASAFSEGLAVAKRGADWGFVDIDGEWAIEPRFEEARPFKNGVARVLVTIPGERGGPPLGSSWELVDRSGETVARAAGGAVDGDLHDGLARVHLSGGRTSYGYARRDGTLALAIDADSCGDFQEERAWFSRGGVWRVTPYLLNGQRTEGSTFVHGLHRALRDRRTDSGGAARSSSLRA